jgi:hypothetical protein
VGYPHSIYYSTKAENNVRRKNNVEAKLCVLINIDLLRGVKQVSAARDVTLLYAK